MLHYSLENCAHKKKTLLRRNIHVIEQERIALERQKSSKVTVQA